MKNNIKYILILSLIILLGSCDKFLEETSQDEIIPKTVNDYSEFLFGEAYLRDYKVVHEYLELMTDDVQSHYSRPRVIANDTRESGFGYYTWQEHPETSLSGVIKSDKTWQTYYRCILISNMVLNDSDKIRGDKSDIIRLKAEAHMIRAYSYFMLVNLYGKPYNANTADEDLGVPINEMTYMADVKLVRESVLANYNYIIKEMETAINYFKDAPGEKNIFRWNLSAAQLFASRVYLYMKEYDKTEQYATKIMETNPSLYDLNIKAADETASSLNFLNSSNPEILFSYGDYYIYYYSSSPNGCFPASESLKNAFASNDLRYSRSEGAFIRQQGNFFGRQYTTFKSGSKTSTQVYGYAIRTAEAYLNRAEAYAIQGKVELAMEDINRLRRARIKSSSYSDVTANNKEEAIELVKKERRLELCYEQHRWFDLRRWDQPQIVHEFVEEYSPYTTSTYTLNKNDNAYTLPIPVSVIDYQPDMPNNARPNREKN
ncbi:MAG: RagB/SusD family nutrient uptake outer membrane protein [Bacteroidales bacterium]